MKKLLLPVAVIAASGAYVWSQQARIEAEADPATGAVVVPAAASTFTPPAAPMLPAETPKPIQATIAAPSSEAGEQGAIGGDDGDSDRDDKPSVTAPPIPRARPVEPPVSIVEVSAPAPAPSGYHDGTFKGPAANAYYGLVQVQATIANGKLTNIGILQYPSDRRTSRYINSQALPMLEQEAISLQTGDVDFITGATLTSQAFVKSLDGALAKAKA